MKKPTAFTTVVLLLWFTCALGQAPQTFKYQTKAKDASGNNIVNRSVSFRMSIVQGTLSGPAVYQETDTATTNPFGLATLDIGKGTVISGSMSAINWSNGPYFIKIEFDPNGGNNFTLMGTSQMLSVPYALYSQSAGAVYSKTPGQGMILSSPNGNCWQITVSNTGAITATPIACP
ncbi:MAG TPA: hypothetical protein VNZ45_01310 [Bacteroidia bacterium]|jgi:hypothetical protein|nr:hypothetical protein [Bacteroidia bacterium]